MLMLEVVKRWDAAIMMRLVGAFPHVGALMIAVTTSHRHALRSQQIFDWVR